MLKHFELTQANRRALLKLTSGMSAEQLQTIPPGYNNNIIWNLGHIVAIQQKLMYGLSGNPFKVPNEFVFEYQNGTFPKERIEDQEISIIRQYLETTIDEAKMDWENGLFHNITAFDTRIKVKLENFEDITLFNFFHEGIHTGHILCLIKFIS